MSQHKPDAPVVDDGCACEVDIKENDILKREHITLQVTVDMLVGYIGYLGNDNYSSVPLRDGAS